MSSDTVKVVLIGIAGYGETYVDAILNQAQGRNIRLAAAVDPYPERCRQLALLRERGIPVVARLEDVLRREKVDLVINATPIHLHRPLTCEALAHGSHVLCEKPLAATIQEALEMQAESRKANRFTAIGYQWSFCDAVQALKRDVLAGVLGRPHRLKTLVSWPRTAKYYHRNNWAGALKTTRGEWVLDSPLNNATAHYLHNMLYLLGPAADASATPSDIQAELYRANPIANFDTAMLRCRTTGGTEILFCTSHAVPSVIGPVLEYAFENAVVRYDAKGDDQAGGRHFTATFRDGTVRDYGNPDDTARNKLWQSAECVRTGTLPVCGIAASIPHTLCVNGAQDSASVKDFPAETIVREFQPEEDTLTWVEGLREVMQQCYARWMLPSELESVAWAQAGRVTPLGGYAFFPSGRPH